MITKRFEPGRSFSLLAGLGVLVVVYTLFIHSSWAQDATAEKITAKTATAFPAGLDDPHIGLDELQLRLVPLTAEQLAPLAAAWQQHAYAAAQSLTDKSLALRAAEGAEKEALRLARLEQLEERNRIFSKFGVVVSSFEAKGGDPAEAQAMRAYMSAVISASKSQLTLQEFADAFLGWLASPEGGLGIGIRTAVIIASLFGLFIVARIARVWADRVFSRVPSLSKLLSGFLVMVVYWLTITFGLMIVLAALGVNITPLFALLGGASFIIAFAMQETLGNLAAGLMIMINRPFDEGDYVQIAGLGGTVRHVSVVSTTITTPDNQVIVIPNSKVWGDVITNVTASDTRRVDLVFGISYGDSIEQAQKVLEQVVANHPDVLEDPAPMIRVSELADNSVNFIVRPWTKTSDYWTTYWDLQRAVKEAFDANGITIPFPQRDMHLHLTDSESAATNAATSALTGGDTKRSRGASHYAKHDHGADEPEEDGATVSGPDVS